MCGSRWHRAYNNQDKGKSEVDPLQSQRRKTLGSTKIAPEATRMNHGHTQSNVLNHVDAPAAQEARSYISKKNTITERSSHPPVQELSIALIFSCEHAEPTAK